MAITLTICTTCRMARALPTAPAGGAPGIAGAAAAMAPRDDATGAAPASPSDMPASPAQAPAPTPAYVNIDEVVLRGGEIEASYASGRLGLTAALSLVEGKDGDGGIVDSLPNNRIVIGPSWQATPEWKIGAFSTFAAGRDKSDGSRRGGYAVHDAYAIWTPQQGVFDGVEMRFGVENLTDKTYVPATWTTGPAPGRNLTVSVTRAF